MKIVSKFSIVVPFTVFVYRMKFNLLSKYSGGGVFVVGT